MQRGVERHAAAKGVADQIRCVTMWRKCSEDELTGGVEVGAVVEAQAMSGKVDKGQAKAFGQRVAKGPPAPPILRETVEERDRCSRSSNINVQRHLHRMPQSGRACGSLGAVDTTAAATFCATLVDEWVRGGVTAAFVAPGSRSTPLALALADSKIAVHVFHDERVAAFAALGHGLATRTPGVVLCSSGTAGAHFYAAVIEADLSAVPMLVCTADRPPSLWSVGAPQVIDQTRLFGASVRFFGEPGVPRDEDASTWRPLAARAVGEAMGWSGQPGPVHLNLSFEDPLAGVPGPLPDGRVDGAPWNRARPVDAPWSGDLGALVQRMVGRSGVIIAGQGSSDPGAVVMLARKLGWPVLADHQSGCRRPDEAICHFDSLLREATFAEARRPQVVLRFGRVLSSKALSQWIASSGADVIVATGKGRWTDPELVAATVVEEHGLASALLERLPVDLTASTEREQWRTADAQAAVAVADALAALDGRPEPQIAREVTASVASGGALVLASSMPVRDVEWFAPGRSDIAVYANRGANGIDGVISTAIGVALSRVPTTVLIGDVAMLHDSTALIGLANRTLDLTIVVVDNDGGGIFGFLPQHELLDDERFEQLFGTPHGTDIAALATAHGITVADWNPAEVQPPGLRLVHLRTDRDQNLADHAALHGAVAAALS